MYFAIRRIEPLQSRYFDMWRGGLALAVVLGHACEIFFPLLQPLFSAIASAAVMGFFALSGFFIHKSLARCWEHGPDWRAFARARINRIVPPFVLAIGLTVGLWVVAPWFFATGTRAIAHPTARTAFSLEGLAPTLVFLNTFVGPTVSANRPLWSLSFEVWYYALACLGALALAGRRVGWLAVPMLLLTTGGDKWFAIMASVWLGGFALSVWHGNGGLAPLRPAPVWVLPAALLLLTLAAPQAWASSASFGFRLAFGGWMVWHMAYALGRPTLPISPMLVRTGHFSYTLYVIHFPLLLFADGISARSGWVALPATIACAAAIGLPLERWRMLPERGRKAHAAVSSPTGQAND